VLQVTTPYGRVFNIAQPFFLTSVFLNVLISASLVGRLLWYRRKIAKALGAQRINGVQYTELASMLIEAAIPYMVFSLMSFLFVTTKSPLAMTFTTPFGFVQVDEIFLQSLSQLTCLCLTDGFDHDDNLQSCNGLSLVFQYRFRRHEAVESSYL
jgi:hypothetical protein